MIFSLKIRIYFPPKPLSLNICLYMNISLQLKMRQIQASITLDDSKM